MYTINVFIIILVVNASILTGGVTADELPNDRQVAKGRVEVFCSVPLC